MRLLELRAAARAAGLRTFDTGQPCKNGHNSARYTSNGGCLECMGIGGRLEAPLAPGPAFVSRRYHFKTVVPLEYTPLDEIRLECYLVRCMIAFAEQKGVALPPYSLARVEWAESTGRPMSEAPI